MSQHSVSSESDEVKKTSTTSSQTEDSTVKESPIEPDRFLPNREEYRVVKNRSCFLYRYDPNQNTNKFYILQLLKHNKKDKYNLFFRWGKEAHQGTYRIGMDIGAIQDAEDAFDKKFEQKTKLLWDKRYTDEGSQGIYQFTDDEAFIEKILNGERTISRRSIIDSYAEAERASQMKPPSKLKPKKEPQAHAKKESKEVITPFEFSETHEAKKESYLNILKSICFEINVLSDTDFTVGRTIEKMTEELYNQYPKVEFDMKGKPLNDNDALKEAFERIFAENKRQRRTLEIIEQ